MTENESNPEKELDSTNEQSISTESSTAQTTDDSNDPEPKTTEPLPAHLDKFKDISLPPSQT